MPVHRPLRVMTVASRFVLGFQVRDFRHLLLSDSATLSAEHMEFLVLAWFILQETESPFLLGLYAALRYMGTLFSPFYGILVDKYDRTRLLQILRATLTGFALLFLLLIPTGILNVWHVFILVGVAGMARAFDNVVRQTLTPDVVPRAWISNAVALTQTARNMTQILGPIVAGLLLTQFGMSWSYIAIVGLYSIGTITATRLETRPRVRPTFDAASVVTDMRRALAYVRKEEVVLGLLVLAFLVNLTGLPLNYGLLPIYAKEVLDVGATKLGQLLGAYSAGATLGSIAVAFLPPMRRLGLIVAVANIGWHMAILSLASIVSFGPALGFLALAGLAQSFTMVSMSTLLLSIPGPGIRGRVMGLRSLAVYGLPLGLLASGALADMLGVSATFAILGAVGIVLGVALPLWAKRLWHYSRELGQ